jgi:DNA polymerase-4
VKVAKVPRIIFVKPRFDRYKENFNKIQKIFMSTDLVEPLSLDEAYLDVTKKKKSSASLLWKKSERIFNEVGLTASAEFQLIIVAKIASDYNKPNGQS